MDRSTITYTYYVDVDGGGRETYCDVVQFPGATRDMWKHIPKRLLTSLLESLCIMCGINYWKIHCAPEIVIEGFSLTREQAEFWDEVYTKGLGEFFYRSQIDFRGLISFPYKTTWLPRQYSARFPRSARLLLLNGGGKDSIVSAELLKARGMEFDLFALNPIGLQNKVAEKIGHPQIVANRWSDQKRFYITEIKKVASGFPSISTATFIALLAAALHDYRYVVLSNESSADIGNLDYLGLSVNHQWSKSSESESLLGNYIRDFISPDVVQFSLLRQLSEIEMVRQFVQYPSYLHSFSSCNMNFFKVHHNSEQRADHAYWCNECPKCVFIFGCLAAFLPKTAVVDIFGADLFDDQKLLPIFRNLLGIEGFKPFECVGTPEEMIVAMFRARQTGAYDGEPAMNLFSNYVLSNAGIPIEDMERRVFSANSKDSIPEELRAALR